MLADALRSRVCRVDCATLNVRSGFPSRGGLEIDGNLEFEVINMKSTDWSGGSWKAVAFRVCFASPLENSETPWPSHRISFHQTLRAPSHPFRLRLEQRLTHRSRNTRCFLSSAKTCLAQQRAHSPPPPPDHSRRCKSSAALLIPQSCSIPHQASRLYAMRSESARAPKMSRAIGARAGSGSRASCRRVLSGTCC